MKKTIYLLSILLLIGLISCQNSNKQNELIVIAGTGNPGFTDGLDAELFKPIRLTPYKENSILFADINNHAIRMVDQNGEVTTIAGGPDKKGFADGNADSAKLASPHGVAYNKTTNKIFVASASNHIIREISETENGEFLVNTIAGIPETKGYKDGSVDSALFNSPHGVLVREEDGALVVIDIGNAKLRLIKDGVVSTIAGNTDADPLKIDFYYPIDLAFDGDDILIADAGNHKIFRIQPGKSAEAIQLNDTLNTPHGITADEDGSIYIADMGTNRILKIDSEGNLSTLVDATTDTTSVSCLKKPAAVLYDNGYLWIADLNNHQLKRLDLR